VLEGDVSSTATLLGDDGVGRLTITDPNARRCCVRQPALPA
jgi:hypothetical protein